MAITILPPSDSDDDLYPASTSTSAPSSPSSSDSPPRATPALRPTKRLKLSSSSHKNPHRILIPGDLITTEPQWMRGHGTYIPPTTPSSNAPSTTNAITATLPGPLLITNKLLSIHALFSTRYTASIGDLVIGRIVSLDKSRWRVDICAPLLAHLPLSAINLPGGVLRRRTTADELQMRSYFQEGDLVLAEVQNVGGEGVAMLHTRSLRYGKLRDGCFLAVNSAAAAGGGWGVVRGKRQVFVLRSTTSVNARGRGSGMGVEVALGVNGFVWVSAWLDPAEGGEEKTTTTTTTTVKSSSSSKMGISISNLDDVVSNEIYSSQNHQIDARTRREIARVCLCITLLAEAGCRVDEDTVTRAYHAAVEEEMEMMLDDEEAPEVTTDLKKRIVQAVVGE